MKNNMENQKPNPVVWFEIYVEDMKRAQQFYETVFETKLNDLLPPGEEGGLQMKSFPNEITNFGSGGALVQMPGFKGGGNGTLVYFGSSDCSREENRIEAAGGSIFRPKFSIGKEGFVVLATDTEGNMFGVHSME